VGPAQPSVWLVVPYTCHPARVLQGHYRENDCKPLHGHSHRSAGEGEGGLLHIWRDSAVEREDSLEAAVDAVGESWD